MNCKNLPITLTINSDNPEIYDPINKKWNWVGTLYYTCECLANGQKTISPQIVPNIPSQNYTPIINKPVIWDFCNSRNCNYNTNTILLSFTFNPNSKNPKDYLLVIINTVCGKVIYTSQEQLQNLQLKFNIQSFTRSVEIWLDGKVKK